MFVMFDEMIMSTSNSKDAEEEANISGKNEQAEEGNVPAKMRGERKKTVEAEWSLEREQDEGEPLIQRETGKIIHRKSKVFNNRNFYVPTHPYTVK